MEQSRRNEFKSFFGKMKEPVAIVDKRLKCVYSNRPKLIPQDSSVKDLFCGDAAGLLSAPNVKMAVINGCSYSVKVTPLEELYICEFYDLSSIIELAENTDIYSRLFPIVDAVETNTAALWRGVRTLEDKLSENVGALKLAAEMRKRLIALSSCSKNILEYMNMLKFTPNGVTPMNLVSFTSDVVKRCNTELSAIERCVEFVCVEQELYINAQNRHVLSALVKVIQNALMYSTRDCVPTLTLSRRKNSASGEAVITLVNDSLLYSKNDGEQSRLNFSGQRLGYGIPIIKRFAELSGGTFELREANGEFTAMIELPLVDESMFSDSMIRLSSGGYVAYQTEIPGIVELKMLEVVGLFEA